MSTRSSGMWFCHECQSEMRAEMHPDPICSVCHSSFVEQLDPASRDDPRNFTPDEAHPGPMDEDQPAALPGLLNFLFGRMAVANDDIHRLPPDSPTRRSTVGGPHVPSRELQFHLGPGTMRLSTGTGRLGAGPGEFLFPLPPSSPYRSRSPSGAAPHMTPHGVPDTFQQYILALLNGADSPFGLTPGRAGDYVFTQEALDALMTQLMEGNGAHTASPASQETRDALPRSTVTATSDLLNRDCAVCKDGFEVGQKTLALPCTHSFHDECILPWLEINGTCPVCRTPASGAIEAASAPPPPRPGPGPGNGPHSPHSPRSPRSPRSNSNPNMPGGLAGHYWESLD